MMTGMLHDQRRALMEKANAQGFTVIGRNGERLPGRIAGYKLDFPVVHVNHPFGPVQFEISWKLVKKIADGQAPIIGGI